MNTRRTLFSVTAFVLVLLCSCDRQNVTENKPSPTSVSAAKDLEYLEEDSTLEQYEVKEDNTIELSYLLSIVNNTDDTKYFYLYADMAKEDDNLVKEDVIPACEKKTEQKRIFKLEPKQGKEEYLHVVFKGTHGKQELKENNNTLGTDNLIIEEIDQKDISEDAEIVTVDDEW